MELVDRILKGDKRAAARLITMVEDERPEASKCLSLLHKHTGRAHIIGITGPPGAGKSTLVDKLTETYRGMGRTVGIIAVDPTSPFTGGAILGDRIRMNRHSTDEGVFIRSMSTRGHLGGISKATKDAVKILDAFGMDMVLVETVGAGQSEVEIVKQADTLVVVEIPGSGDDIQMIKAGILEIGDIFAVNKADRDGVDKTVSELETMLDLDPNMSEGKWRPPIVKTVAHENKGIEELVDAIGRHIEYIKNTGEYRKKVLERTESEFIQIVKENLTKYVFEKAIDKGEFDELIRKIMERQIDPYSAADKILKPFSDMVNDE